MTEENRDRQLPKIFAEGVINNPAEEGIRGPDFEDPETLLKALVNISERLGINPPVTTSEKLYEWLEIQEMTNKLGPDEEDPDIELTEEEWTEALRLEKRGAKRWGQFEIPFDKVIPPN